MPDTAAAPAARRRAPRGQGAALRGELLGAAMALLAETGDEDAVSMRAVAQRVGVSVPAVYLHFADKQALIAAVCEQVFHLLDEQMQAASADADHPFEALRLRGIAYVEFVLANPEHYRITMMSRDDHPHEPGEELSGSAFAHLVEAVQACIDDGVFVGEPVPLALQLWAAVHGVASLLIAKPDFPWPPVAEFVDATIRMAGLGLATAGRVQDLPCEGPTAPLLARLEKLRP